MHYPSHLYAMGIETICVDNRDGNRWGIKDRKWWRIFSNNTDKMSDCMTKCLIINT